MAGKNSAMDGTRRERRIIRKRAEILEAAARIFARKGYGSTSTKDIAEAADVGESTLYGYFRGKNEILLAILAQKKGEIDTLLARIEKIEDRESLVTFIDEALNLWISRLSFTRTLATEAWTDATVFQTVGSRVGKVHGLIKNYLDRRIRAGDFKSAETRRLTSLILGMFFGIALPILLEVEPIPSPADRRSAAEMMAEVLIHGIAAGVPTGKF
jgi:AcrR family transcriptional regulator